MKNDKYDSEGTLGSYRTSESPFPNAAGVVTFPGYGADKEDLERGFCRPTIRDLPEYKKENYEDRYTQAMDITKDYLDIFEPSPDQKFREIDRQSKGFLTRPRIPTER